MARMPSVPKSLRILVMVSILGLGGLEKMRRPLKSIPQGLKPNSFCEVYVRAKQAAEIGLILIFGRGKILQGLKPSFILGYLRPD
jgi:hypothetical protein